MIIMIIMNNQDKNTKSL